MSGFQGEHSFIHYDSEQSRPRKQRSEVQRHIQNQYNPWRRQPRSARLKGKDRKPPKLAETTNTSSPVSVSTLATYSADDLPLQQRGLRPLLPQLRRSVTAPESQHSSLRLSQGAVCDAIEPSPRSLLQRGNSDPFKTCAIDITPFANQAITYFRDVMVPQRYQPEARSITPLSRAMTYWQSFVPSLDIVAVGNGLMTAVTTVLARDVNPALGEEMLKYKGKLLQSARKVLTTPHSSFSEIHLMILLLWVCELEANNLVPATHHAEMLVSFFGQLDPTRLIAISQPLFEYTLAVDEFHTKLTSGPAYFGFPAYDLNPLLGQLAYELDYPLTGVNLSTTPAYQGYINLTPAFFQLRAAVKIDHFIDTRKRKFPESVFRQIDTIRLLCQARLSSSYHELRSGLSEISSIDAQRADVALIAAATMAALEWSRMFYVGNAFSKLPWLYLGALRDAIDRYDYVISDTFETAQLQSALGEYPEVLEALEGDQATWETSHASPPAPSLDHQAIRARQELWLWTLYVTAHAEQTDLVTLITDSGTPVSTTTTTTVGPSTDSETTPPSTEEVFLLPMSSPHSPSLAARYSVRFAQQAQNMGLTDWETGIKPVLEKFLFSNRMRPRADEWVGKVLWYE